MRKVAGKNQSVKRKLGVFNEEFTKHRYGDSSEAKFNKHCDTNGLEDYKVQLEEVDVSNVIELNVGCSQAFADCSIYFKQQFQ